MRILFLLFLLVVAAPTAEAADKQWYVNVFGENAQLVTGAAANSKIIDGQFLDQGFVGKEMYVRSQEHYELDQFRPKKSSAGSTTAVAAVMAEDTAVARNMPEKPAPMTEFGPLADTGLQFAVSGDFHGWYCPQLYVKPLGGRTYRLRCETDMRYE